MLEIVFIPSVHPQYIVHNKGGGGWSVFLLFVLPVVEEVAGLDIPVDDVMGVDLLQSQEQRSHVLSGFIYGHVWNEVLWIWQ